MVDISIDHTTMATLQSMVGKTFERYSCDPFLFTPTVIGIVGLYIGGKSYKLTSDLESVECLFDKEDFAIMKIAPCQPNEIVTRMVDGQLIDTPVQDRIVRIDVVNDLEALTHDDERSELHSTKGVVFYLASGNEISFEIEVYFSEMITIRRGYNLVAQFTPVDDFLEGWKAGYVPDSEREVVTLD
ncbi:MAG: hypothetical protein Q4G03_00165 [Planctomycetia bacterium]|nr:hypothetical protein [Planctomycetia bacterium]